MQVFRAYLWKEWREQRALLGALALGLAVAVGIIGAVLDEATLSSSFTYDWVVSICFGAALVTVGSDLFGRERQRSQLGFVERLPAGLAAAFRAKLAFFVLLLLAATAYGLLLAAIVSFGFTGELPAPVFNAARIPFGLLALLAALWVFAVSTWVPTSVMTLPVAAILVALCLLPGWLLVRGVTHPIPHGDAFLPILAAAAFGALVCARISFVNAAARSRPRRVAVWCGLGLAVLSFAPYTAWARAELVEWENWPFVIHSALVGEGAEFAFVTLERKDPQARGRNESRSYSTLVLDLDSGDWRMESKAEPAMFSYMYLSDPLNGDPAERPIALYGADGELSGRVYDVSTGLPTGERFVPSFPASTCTPADFGLEHFSGRPRVRWAGLGQLLHCLGPDADAHQYVRTPDGQAVLRLKPPMSYRTRALEHSFLTCEGDTWSWIDPHTYELRPFEHLREGEQLGPTLTDGTLIVWNEAGVALLDPLSGAREEVAMQLEGGAELPLRSLWLGEARGWPAPISAENPIVVILYIGQSRGEQVAALFDIPARTLRVPDWDTGVTGPNSIVWTKGQRAIAIEDGWRLVLYDFEIDGRCVLFDAADLQL
jgi:hypothetical protein